MSHRQYQSYLFTLTVFHPQQRKRWEVQMCDWLRIERPTREWDCGDDAQEVAGGNLPDITRFYLATTYVSFVVGKNVANSLSVFDSLLHDYPFQVPFISLFHTVFINIFCVWF